MKYALLIIYSLCCMPGLTQNALESQQEQPVITILQKIEELHQIKFSYQPEIVSDIDISIHCLDNELDIVLKEIAQKARLKFTAINKRYFVINKADSTVFSRINGLVIDSLNQISLPIAHIYNVTQQNGVTSNSNGEFTLHNVNENDWIEVRFIGYKKMRLRANTIFNDSIISLSPGNINISEVLVKNYITRGFYRNKDGSFSIDLNATPTSAGLTDPDVLETVQNIPGIHSPDESASNLHIRGGTPDQNLILWDGIKLYQIGHFSGTYSSFNPFVVEQVVIEKSGTSAKFGNRISGLIDMNTANKIPQDLHMGIGTTLNHADFFIKTPIVRNKMGVVFSFRRSFNDWMPTITSNQHSERTFQNIHLIDLSREYRYATKHDKTYNYHDYNCKIINEFSPSNRLTTSFLYNENNLDYSIRDTYYADYTRDKMNINNWGLNLEWQHIWNRHLKQTTQLRQTDYKFKFRGEYLFNEEYAVNMNKRNNISDIDIQSYLDWQISPNVKSVLGYLLNASSVSYLLENRYPGEEVDVYKVEDSSDDITHSLYNEYTWQIKDRMYFNGGLRASYYKKGEYFAAEPRVKIEYSFSDQLRYRISGEYKTQSINQIVEFTTEAFGLENQLWTLSDGDELPYIESKQISTGLLFTPGNWQIDIDTYYKLISNISTFTKGFSGYEANTENGEKTISGVDCLVKKQFNDLGIFMSYSWMNAKLLFNDLNGGKSFPDNFDIRHKLYLAGDLKWNKFNFALGWKFHTGKPYTHFGKSAEFNFVDGNFPLNTKRLPEYHRLDFSTNYTIHLKKDYQHKLRFSIAFQNIYNRKNIIDRTYLLYGESEGVIDEVLRIDRRGLKLTPNLSVRYWF